MKSHRHLGRGPGAHDPGARRLRDRAPRPDPARPRRPAAGRARRGAAPAGAHRGGRRPGPAGRAHRRPGALCELVNDDGSMMRAPECRVFADEHGLVMISIADLIALPAALRSPSSSESPRPCCRPRTASSAPSATASRLDGIEHVALVMGEIGDGDDVLVRVHSECLTGDVFGSLRCDCGPQLAGGAGAPSPRRAAASCSTCAGTRAAASASLHKLQAYQLQDAGSDTVDANLELGLPADARDYGDRGADPRRPRRALDAAADQQPGQARRARGLRAVRSSVACRCRSRPTRAQPALPRDQARPHGPRACPTSGPGT